MEKVFIDFFQKVAIRDNTELNNLKQCCLFKFEPKKWHFTLPKLFEYFINTKLIPCHYEYKQFRKNLYQLSINKYLSAHNVKIVIHNNEHNVDESEYSLVWE